MLYLVISAGLLFSAYSGEACSPLRNAPAMLLPPPPPLFPALQDTNRVASPAAFPLLRDYEDDDNVIPRAPPIMLSPPANVALSPPHPEPIVASPTVHDASVVLLTGNNTDEILMDSPGSNHTSESTSTTLRVTTTMSPTTTRPPTTRYFFPTQPRQVLPAPISWFPLSRFPAPPSIFADPFQAKKNIIAVRRDTEPIVHERKSRMLPSLFDLFRPLTLGFRNIFEPKTGPAQFDKVPRAPSPFVSNPTFQLQCSPPISWTFCDPICGSGDQAVDAENSVENAQMDIKEAVFDGFRRIHLGLPNEDAVTIQYQPSSAMLEDFGDYFDRQGYKYKVNGNAVAFRIHKNNTQALLPFSVEVTASVRYQTSLTAVNAKQIANYMYQYLSLRKGARFVQEIKVKELSTQLN